MKDKTKPVIAKSKAKAVEPISNSQKRGKPAGTQSELLSKLARVKRQLEEMRDYKRILAESGLRPDEQDKIKESGFIKQLLSLEKQLGIDSKAQKAQKAKGAGKKRDARRPASPKGRRPGHDGSPKRSKRDDAPKQPKRAESSKRPKRDEETVIPSSRSERRGPASNARRPKRNNSSKRQR